MRKALIATVAAMLLAGGASAAPRTWELREGGQWHEVQGPTTSPVREQTLDRIEDLLRTGQTSAAHKAVVEWLQRQKDSPARDRGLYLLGECNYRDGDRILAFHNFDELLDLHPSSPYCFAAIERQYQIADTYLSGYKDKFLGLRIASRTDEAIQMLYRIQQRSPGSAMAEKALLRTADYYYENGDVDLAADAYGAYIRNYPRSPNLPLAKLKRAFAVLREYRGRKFNATPVLDARQQLIELRAGWPDLAAEKNLSDIITRLDEDLAKKTIETAQFYERTHQPKAAAYQYRYLLANFPNTPQVSQAQSALAALPESARALPSTLPTTNPSPR